MNIVTKEGHSMRRPPEVPALVVAARERAGKLKHNQNQGPSPFETSKFRANLNETAPMSSTD